MKNLQVVYHVVGTLDIKFDHLLWFFPPLSQRPTTFTFLSAAAANIKSVYKAVLSADNFKVTILLLQLLFCSCQPWKVILGFVAVSLSQLFYVSNCLSGRTSQVQVTMEFLQGVAVKMPGELFIMQVNIWSYAQEEHVCMTYKCSSKKLWLYFQYFYTVQKLWIGSLCIHKFNV